MCEVKLNERKKVKKLELFGLEPLGLMMK